MRAALICIIVIFSTRAMATSSKITLLVEGMTCPSCAASVEKHLKALPQVDSVDIGLSAGTVTVTLKDGSSLSNADAFKAVEEAGYRVRAP